MAEIGETLAKLLDAHHVSQSELARRLKVERSSVGQWIHGKTYPTLSNLLEISRIFNVSLSVFGDPDVEKPLIDNELSTLPPEVSDLLLRQWRSEVKRIRKIGKIKDTD